MNQGQDLLYSDDEESHPCDYNESTILLSTLNGGDQTENAPYNETNQLQSDYGSLNSPSSSLNDSDYERRESQYRTYPARVRVTEPTVKEEMIRFKAACIISRFQMARSSRPREG
jgi:hypothetical protein